MGRPTLKFISNIDGDQIFNTLKSLNCETTSIVVSSKTLATKETMKNFEIELEVHIIILHLLYL